MLRRIIVEEHLPAHSFPICHDGSKELLGVKDLIKICTRPQRFQFQIRRQEPIPSTVQLVELSCQPQADAATPTEPTPTSIDAGAVPGPPPGAGPVTWHHIQYSTLFMCPGGRWVFAYASDGEYRTVGLLCWDLEDFSQTQGQASLVSQPCVKAHPVAYGASPLPWDSLSLLARYSAKSGNSCSMISVLRCSLEEEGVMMCGVVLFEAKWNSDSSSSTAVTIETRGLKKFPWADGAQSCDLYIDDERVVLSNLRNDSIMIWDWVRDKSTNVSVVHPIAMASEATAFLRNSTLIVLGRHNMSPMKFGSCTVLEGLDELNLTDWQAVHLPSQHTSNDQGLEQYEPTLSRYSTVDAWIPPDKRRRALHFVQAGHKRMFGTAALVVEPWIGPNGDCARIIGASGAGSRHRAFSSPEGNCVYAVETFLSVWSDRTNVHVVCYLYDVERGTTLRSAIQTPLARTEWMDEYTEGFIQLSTVQSFCPWSGTALISQSRGSGEYRLALLRID
ncbi:hypothetical protein DL93DRAFT_2070049 [Clavulina sp. PMI_390]|nr:hypothetical protein DL93DRAFT_2070049 [Clavulina sp. PMI_390]